MKRLLIPLAAAVSLAVASCGHDHSDEASQAPSKSLLPESFAMSTEAGGMPVLALRESAKDGDEVIVAGRAREFVDGRAAFTLIDASLRACSDEGDPMQDACKTPWDYCCIEPKEISKASCTVEFHGAGGLLETGVRGFHGLDYLDHVVVRGKVSKDEAGNLTVRATGINVL